MGTVGRAGARAGRTVTHGRHYRRSKWLAVTWACFEPPLLPDLHRWGEEILPPGPVPVISTALFLKVLITVPSFRRRRGLLLLSATFCFSLERTFKLGSEAGERVAGAQGSSTQNPEAHPSLIQGTSELQQQHCPFHMPTSTLEATFLGARTHVPVLRRGKSSRLS